MCLPCRVTPGSACPCQRFARHTPRGRLLCRPGSDYAPRWADQELWRVSISAAKWRSGQLCVPAQPGRDGQQRVSARFRVSANGPPLPAIEYSAFLNRVERRARDPHCLGGRVPRFGELRQQRFVFCIERFVTGGSGRRSVAAVCEHQSQRIAGKE